MARQSSAAASRRAKTGAAGATCTLTRLMARRFLRPPGLLFHARPPICSRGRWSEAERRTSRCGARPRAKRVNRTGTGNDAQRGLSPPCLVPTTPRRNGADRGNRTLMGFRPSAPRADVSTIPPHPHEKMEHPQGRAPCCLSYQDSPSLSTGWMQNGRSGRTRTSALRLPRFDKWGARAGFAPATVSL
jgi:hypothetical protein